MFLRGEDLLAQRFDYRTGTLSGETRPISAWIPAGTNAVSAAQDGTVVFHSYGFGSRQVQLVNEYGSVIAALSEPAKDMNLRLSPDASRVAITQRGPEGSLDVYVHDIDRRVTTRLTSNPAADGVPVWSPDGSEIAFASWRDGGSNLYVIASNASREERPLLRSPGTKYPDDWSPDGAYLLFEVARPESSWDLWLLPLKVGSAPFPYVTTPANEKDGRFSPDGNWVAYTSNETGQQEVYVQSFPAGKGKWRISRDGGGKPVWAHSGKTLYFLDPAGTLMAASISLGDHFVADKPVRQFSTGASYSTLGGQLDADRRGRFVVLSEVRKPTPTVVIGWRPELR